MILFNDFLCESPELHSAIIDATARVLGSGHYVLGPEVSAFEQAWVKSSRVSHCVGVANGMDALEIGLRALGLGPGDEVITTPMTALATVLAIVRVGAIPVLGDIDIETGLLDQESIRRCMSPRTKAVIVVHLYGRAADLASWSALVNELGIWLVEDCAQAHLATSNGIPVGSVGILGAFSFYPTKNLGAVGDAGAIVTNDEELAGRMAMLRNYGQENRYVHPVIGVNSRLDEIQAAILRCKLSYLEEWTERRRSNASRYRKEIGNPLVRMLQQERTTDRHVHHLFVVRVAARDAFQKHLALRGVQSLVHYPVPAHHQPPFSSVGRDPLGLSNTEIFARECVSLPIGPHLSSSEVDAVVDAVNSYEVI